MTASPHNPVLTSAPLPLFLRYASSASLALLAISSATLVDGLVVGQVLGSEAMAAITLLIPYFTLVFSLALALAIGGSVRASHLLGQGKTQQASALLTAALLAVLLLTLSNLALVSWQMPQLFKLLGAPTALQPLMQPYLQVMLWAMLLQLFTLVLYYFVRADQHGRRATQALVVGACANMLLDVLFVGVWQSGLAGAAWATLLAQVLQLAVLLTYWRSPRRQLRLPQPPAWRELGQGIRNGLSELVNELSVGLVLWLINAELLRQSGSDGVAAFTLVNYVIFVGLMSYYGIVDALHPLVGQNAGAQRWARVRSFIGIAAVLITSLSLLLIALLLGGGHWLSQLFLPRGSAEVQSLTLGFIQILWPIFVFNGFNVLVSASLTALEHAWASLTIALSRGLVLPVLFLLGLPLYWPELPFLLALPLAELLTSLLAILLLWLSRSSLPPLHRTARTAALSDG